MTRAPQTPLDYRQPAATPPARSGWRIVGLLLGGFVFGIVPGIAIAVGIGLLFPTTSRAQAGQLAGYAFFGGLGLAACSIPVAIYRRWLYAGILVGTGAVIAFWGFAVGMMSSITC